MKIWGLVRTDQRIVRDIVIELDYKKRDDVQEWSAVIGDAARELDLSRPVVLKKHIKELHSFGRTVFKPSDFMESVDFDKFEIEIFHEKTKDKK